MIFFSVVVWLGKVNSLLGFGVCLLGMNVLVNLGWDVNNGICVVYCVVMVGEIRKLLWLYEMVGLKSVLNGSLLNLVCSFI